MRRALVFGVSCLGLLAGCALFTDLTGYSDPPKRARGDSGSVDGPHGDGGIKPFGPNADGGGDNNPLGDGGGTPRPCNPISVEETFAGGFGEFTPLSSAPDRGYPKRGTWDSSAAALLLPMELDVDAGQSPDAYRGLWAGIWRFKELPLVAFDIEVEAFIGCPEGDACGDGFAIQWTTMQTAETLTANAIPGGGLGLALHTSGGAVAADLHPNSEFGDTTDKSLQVIQLRGSENDLYQWVANMTPKATEGAWHKYKVTMRNGLVAVDYDSLTSFVSANVTPIDKGMVGISTGTGGLINGVAVKNFKGRFYDCTPP